MLNKRSQILINKNFQLKFSGLLLIPILIIQTLSWLAIEIFFKKMIARGEAHHLPADHNYYNLLAMQKNELTTMLITLSIIVAIFMFIWGLYISHRIAGPFDKMENYLNDAKTLDEVKKSELEFRKNDFFLNIPKAFNEFISRI
jgi:ABC-type multidrug transport system permease subunit